MNELPCTLDDLRRLVQRAVRRAHARGRKKGRHEGREEVLQVMGRVGKSGLTRLVRKAWSEDSHPRDDNGRFVGKDALEEARTDPEKAKELRDKVTDPEQRKKLDAAIGKEGKARKTPVGEPTPKEVLQKQKADKEPLRQAAREHLEKSLRGEGDISELRQHIEHLTRDEIREHVRALEAKVGGKKAELADRLIERVKAKVEAKKTDPTLDFSTDGMDPQATTPAAGLKPGGATRQDRQEYLNKKDAAERETTRSPVDKHPVEHLYDSGSPAVKDALESAAHNLPETLTTKDLPGYLGRFKEGTPQYHSARRKLAVQLSSSLAAMHGYAKDQYTDAERKQMEDVMTSLVPGLKKIDSAESFDGSLHDGETGMFTGHKGVVEQPGWKIQDGGDEFVVRKAKVRKFREKQ